MSRVYTEITPELAAYIREATLREPESLRRLRERTEKHPRANWQISPEQGQFLLTLATGAGARKALEIGVFMGYSAAWIAQALPSEGRLIACELSDEYVETARALWQEAGVESKIDLRMGPALETLDGLLTGGHAGSFDFIFIDADKTGYVDYYERALQLLRPRGVIAADNALMGGAVADAADRDAGTEAMRAFNRKVRDDARVALTLATVGDGILVAVKL